MADRGRLTLAIEEKLKERLQIAALKEKRSVADILEELIREWLKNRTQKEAS